MSIGIYKITNPNNKVYIGQSVDIEDRWRNHKSKSVYLKNNSPLYNSFKKYGIGAHTFEIIEMCDEYELNNRERYWQEYFNVLIEGLNQRLTETYDISGKLSESHKEKIASAMLGKNNWCTGVARPEDVKKKISETKRKNPYIFTDIQKNKMSESSKGQIPWNLGISPSDETKKKLGDANRGYTHTDNAREKLRLAGIGKIQTAETKAKRYVSRFCKQFSDIQKQKIFEDKLNEYNN